MPYDRYGRHYSRDRYRDDDTAPRVIENHYSHGGDRHVDGGYGWDAFRSALDSIREQGRDIDRRLDRFEHRLEENRRFMVQATLSAAAIILVLFVVLIVTYWN